MQIGPMPASPQTAPIDELPAGDPLAAELRVALGRLMRRLRGTGGMGMTQAAVLRRLEREGPQSTGELAKAEKVRPQSMSQTLSELESGGLIVRHQDGRDLRRMIITITDEGGAALARERALKEGWLSIALAESLSDEERELLARAVALLARLSEL
jgi:DNA-binding MarR family transcriptional regulator